MSDPAEEFASAAPGVQSADSIRHGGQVDYYHADIDATGGTVRIFTPAPETGEAVQRAFQKAAGQWHNPSTHPNVVSVYDRGTEPRPWIAVEMVDGRLLEAVHTDLSVPEVRTLVSGVAEALRNAALYNTTHGELGPDTVWVTETDDGVHARVDKWGLERACRVAAGETARTPFTAPEFGDDAESASEKADVYSLGAVTYYALTGHPPTDRPVRGENGLTPPSRATEHPAVDAAVDDVVLSALAVEPDERYSSAYKFETALTGVLPTDAHPATEGHESNASGTDDLDGEASASDASTSETDDTTPGSAAVTVAHEGNTDANTGEGAETGGGLTRRRTLGAGLLGVSALGIGGWYLSARSGSESVPAGSESVSPDSPTGGTVSQSSVPAPGEVDSYLNDYDVRLYDGDAVDETGSDTVSISVGAGDQNYAFDPVAVVVSTGTTVEWAWQGDLQHNVVANDGTFESERYSSAGVNFDYTFEEAGEYTYYCSPHRQLGMHGAVVVE